MSAAPNKVNREDTLHDLNAAFSAMPPVNAMAIKAVKFDAGVLSVSAPLANNVNDKACAFGGSLVSVMTMAAWGLLSELCRREEIEAEVYIADTQVRFLAPLFGDLNAEARLHADTDWDIFLQTLRSKSRARAVVGASIKNEHGQTMCEMTARFAAIRSKIE
jgi:thioesterase domain-containing protein